ncbi:MAG: FAD:protein FMN transferase [Pirellulales bacterium]|nr:FAD:protein FMN transferase [Pirellulales bacterium]
MNDQTDTLLHVSRAAMACDFEVRFPAGGGEECVALALRALELLEPLEQQLSVFRPDSELSRINLLAAERPVRVEPGLFRLLQRAVELSNETDGALDVTAEPLWRLWGFARREGRLPTEGQIAEALGRVGSRYVRLDPTEQTVSLTRPGVQLNLGCFGKGYAVDRLAEKLEEGGLGDFLLHGGQSSVLARGTGGQATQGTPDSEGDSPNFAAQNLGQSPGWIVGLPDPRLPDRRIAEIRLRDKALGTSSSQFQSFRHAGKRYGHILDPRSGRPAEGVLSATAVAPDATQADALSTAFYVLGPEASLRYCRRRPEIGLLMLLAPQGGGKMEILSAGLGDDELRLIE